MSSTIRPNLTSYDSGSKPFKHDSYRGKWTSIWDFYCSCLCHTFGIKYFTTIPLMVTSFGGIYFVIPYVLGLIVFAIPVFFVQSFLGQFSTSGFISAFRIAPLFKALGYSILFLNLAFACYFSLLAAFPLVYFFSSFNPTLPWMVCSNTWNSENCTVVDQFDNDTGTYERTWSSEEFLHHAVMNNHEDDELRISWRILICTIIVWILVGAIAVQGVQVLGTILRYFTYTIFTILGIILIRLLCLPKAYLFILDYFTLTKFLEFEVWIMAPFTTLYTFGSGWGTILTMASYNNFNQDIGKYSWIIGFSNMGMITLCGLISQIIDEYLSDFYHFHKYFYRIDSFGLPFSAFPYFFGLLGGANFWSMIFYLALFLGELSGCIIQIFSVITALFDEYEPLRLYKMGSTIVIVSVLAIISMAFTFNKGIWFFIHLFKVSGVLTMIICFMEVLVVVWIYGRLRFQRDVQFMLRTKYPTWKFYLLRFLTPIFILILVLFNFLFAVSGFMDMSISSAIATLVVKLIPLFIIPIYFITKFNSTTGTCRERFKKLCNPTDWYPADPVDRRNYEENVASSETFRQLIDDDDDNENVDEERDIGHNEN